MNWVNTTVFFTHCWKNFHRLKRGRAGAVLLLVALALCLSAPTLQAQTPPPTASPEVTELRLERDEEGIYLTARVRFDLPAPVEEALVKGIPIFFVAQAELFRDRWYWYDKRLNATTRHLRLAYQPLTRRWRLNTSAAPITNAGLGLTLGQNYDTLADALAATQRFSRWKIGQPGDVEPDTTHNLAFSFRLDLSQLPRPFQITALGQSDWSLVATRNQRLPADAFK